jgi:trehalose 6-phosphate synthase
MTLILVSNRVARPKANEPINGGLAAALLPAVTASGAIWVGSSGKFTDSAEKREPFAEIEALGTGALATVDLPAAQYRGFYQGFANSALWPVLHSRTDLIRTGADDYAAYCEINSIMARALLRFAKPDALFWIHDYHYLTLGADLRRLGIDQPVGFFLHTPFPARHTLVSLPHHRELITAMLAYDLIGFQTDEDRANFADYLEHELGLSVRGDAAVSERGTTRLAIFPIGIDAAAFADRAARSISRAEVARLRASLLGARLPIAWITPRGSIPASARSTSRCAAIRRSSARSACCRSRCSRAARSEPTSGSRTSWPAWSATSTGAMRKSTGRRSAISTAVSASRSWRAFTGSRASAW